VNHRFETRGRPESEKSFAGFALGVALGVSIALLFLGTTLNRHPTCVRTAVDARINPNTAPIPSLARLPRIGAVRARAMVAFRREMQRQGASLAFERPDDLQRIKGIGPRTVEQVRPWLRFDQTAEIQQVAPE
jgi:hypothetical protein